MTIDQAGTREGTGSRRATAGWLGACALTAALAFAVAAPTANAQSWPTRPLTMVVAFPPGSSSDNVGRIIAAQMSEILGQAIVVENVSGAGGMTGITRVAKSAPDGYTFSTGSASEFAINQVLHKKLAYNAATDFEPVGLLIEQPMMLIARNDLPVDSLRSFVDYIKANHKKMQFGSGGVGSSTHLLCAMINAAVGVDVVHVPYRGVPPAMQDLIAGRIDYFCSLAAAAAAPVENKSVKAIAVLAAERSPLFPDLPSSKEQGLGSVAGYFWTGLFFPKGTPDAIVRRMNEVASQALDSPGMAAKFQRTGSSIVGKDRRTPEYLRALVVSQIEFWRRAVEVSGISVE